MYCIQILKFAQVILELDRNFNYSTSYVHTHIADSQICSNSCW